MGPISNGFARSAVALVVEDDESLRGMLGIVLPHMGVEVLPARSIGEALSVSAAAARIDVVVSDVVLSDGSGLALVEQLRGSRPRLPAVFMTGY